ncbi:cupin domain-containing protein [Aquihabitans sp. G128]|uniref:cupin domain-containing protein n=1 Tax=Aquihabitans sp. G128 TaxID=2849779 RepID=UPI001C215E7A|nr:cupin domain-containing protein [Aquihabitans sp. G128]QXC59398.1 cupin domain-containing protein [Aquihabitans sp. G128]
MTDTETPTPLAVDAAEDHGADPLTASVRLHEYSRAANPVGRHAPRVPVRQFPASLHADLRTTTVVPLDLSSELGIEGPATSPALSASFVHVEPGEPLTTQPVATSELCFVLAGTGTTSVDDGPGRQVPWEAGDLFVVPAGLRSVHAATTPATFYRVTDEPLLRHLGVAPTARRFPTSRFRGADLRAELARIEADPHALDRNRLSVLMATAEQTRTLTVTNVLWAMYGVVPSGAVQKPHRHQSVALDLILTAPPGCYTLVGRSLSPEGDIVDPVRADWEGGGAFTTPPGLWHAHHNESSEPAYLLPVQDAGLLTHLTALDIRFT